ncbi:hypothetical protein D3C77_793260 [compost metagenome]
MQLAQQCTHAGVFDNGAVVDDANMPTKLLGFFQVVGCENNRDALLIQLGEKRPH